MTGTDARDEPRLFVQVKSKEKERKDDDVVVIECAARWNVK